MNYEKQYFERLASVQGTCGDSCGPIVGSDPLRIDNVWATHELRLWVRSPNGLSVQARQLLSYLTDSVHP
ncbi:hypothetical protein ACO0LB_06580 [Undibacterium sp. SXout7W]|uniref:hypothetical protein n=1 Tax=Undibacterium sp. SXout7W TaxID=3413049 RepID=UPI003BF3A1B4